MKADCIFCGMVAKKIPAKVEFEDDKILAIEDLHPQAPVHVLLIPKEHIATINDLKEVHETLVGALVRAAQKIAALKKVTQGYRLVFNNGAEAGQSVFHLHLHLLGGRPMMWPPG